MSSENTRRILLIIDDDGLTRRTLARTLDSPDYVIRTAENGEEALRVLENEPVGVVICDQHMGETLGSDLLDTIKNRFPDVVRLMLTSDQSREALCRAINDGNVRRLLYKPIDDAQVLRLVRQCFGLRVAPVTAPRQEPRRASSLMRIAAILGVAPGGDAQQGGGGGT